MLANGWGEISIHSDDLMPTMASRYGRRHFPSTQEMIEQLRTRWFQDRPASTSLQARADRSASDTGLRSRSKGPPPAVVANGAGMTSPARPVTSRAGSPAGSAAPHQWGAARFDETAGCGRDH